MKGPPKIFFLIISLLTTLCTSFYMILKVAYLYVINFNKDITEVKVRKVPPKHLKNESYGEHFNVEANGLTFHCVSKGDRNKKLMLFVHGFPECWYSWRYQMKEFSDRYWCVAYDQRGFGESDKPNGITEYKLDNLADDILHVSNALLDNDQSKTFILVAHDWGSVAAFQFLSKYNNRVDKYICMDGPPSFIYKLACFTTWDQFKRSWYIFFFQMPYLPELIFRLFDLKGIEMVCDGEYTETITKEDIEVYKYYFSQPGAITPPINYYRNMRTPRQHTAQRYDSKPGLYLMGSNDNYISMRTGYDVERFIPNCQFKIVPNAHHFVQQSNPYAVNEIMQTFLCT